MVIKKLFKLSIQIWHLTHTMDGSFHWWKMSDFRLNIAAKFVHKLWLKCEHVQRMRIKQLIPSPYSWEPPIFIGLAINSKPIE